jgi:large subunit ribosomal protein L18e
MLRHTSVMLERAAKEGKAPIWLVAARRLSSPSKNRVEVNVGRISRIVKAGEAVFVPGKVLGTGTIGKKLVVGAFSFSSEARTKIIETGGSVLTVEEFLKKYPKGSGVKLVE